MEVLPVGHVKLPNFPVNQAWCPEGWKEPNFLHLNFCLRYRFRQLRPEVLPGKLFEQRRPQWESGH